MAKDIDLRLKEKETRIKTRDRLQSYPTQKFLFRKHVSYWMPSE